MCMRRPTRTIGVEFGETDVASCEGCDVVGSDHAPQAGVAQGVGHGPLVGR